MWKRHGQRVHHQFQFEREAFQSADKLFWKRRNIFFRIPVLNDKRHTMLPAGKRAFSFAGRMQVTQSPTHHKWLRRVRCMTNEITHDLGFETAAVRLWGFAQRSFKAQRSTGKIPCGFCRSIKKRNSIVELPTQSPGYTTCKPLRMAVLRQNKTGTLFSLPFWTSPT